MKIPHPGELRQLVEIGCTVHEINENGFPVETEQVVCQVWAKGEDCDSRYFTSGDAENTERGIWFTIRWRSDVQPGMWVLWNGQKQIITEIGEYDFKRRYLRLTTKAVKGGALMKRVQDALRNVGIPVFAGAWKATAENAAPPQQYLVYTTQTYEDEHWDDANRRYRVYVYLNLWSTIDPTEVIRLVRAAMRKAGFAFSDEAVSYNDDTRQTLVAWTWVCWEDDK